MNVRDQRAVPEIAGQFGYLTEIKGYKLMKPIEIVIVGTGDSGYCARHYLPSVDGWCHVEGGGTSIAEATRELGCVLACELETRNNRSPRDLDSKVKCDYLNSLLFKLPTSGDVLRDIVRELDATEDTSRG